MTTDTTRDAFTPTEIAARLGISRDAVYDLMDAGLFGRLLPAGRGKVVQRRLITVEGYAAYLRGETPQTEPVRLPVAAEHNPFSETGKRKAARR